MVTLCIIKCGLNIQNLPLSIKYILIDSVAIVLVMLTKSLCTIDHKLKENKKLTAFLYVSVGSFDIGK